MVYYLSVVYYLSGAIGDWDMIVHLQTAAMTDPVTNSHDRLVVLCRYIVSTHDTAAYRGHTRAKQKPYIQRSKFNTNRPVTRQSSTNPVQSQVNVRIIFLFCLTHPLINKSSTNTSQWQAQPKFIKNIQSQASSRKPSQSQASSTKKQPMTSQSSIQRL